MKTELEHKVLEKIRRLLTDDLAVKNYVDGRVYTEHISLIKNPRYPAISLYLMPDQARTNVPDMVNMLIQIDLWFPVKDWTEEEVLSCYERVKALIDRQDLSDKGLNLVVVQIFETGVAGMMYDRYIQGHHLPAHYAVVAK